MARADDRRALAHNPKDKLFLVMALFGQFKELFVVNYLRWLARHKGRPAPDYRN